MIEQTPEGIVLQSGNESYVAVGKELYDMAGEEVPVTGSLEEKDGWPAINVASVSAIEQLCLPENQGSSGVAALPWAKSEHF